MKEMIYCSARHGKMALAWRRCLKVVRNRITRIVEVVYYGVRLARTNTIFLPLLLLLPLFLILTSDWIGVLVVFQATSAAVRMRSKETAREVAACSLISAQSDRCKGE